MVVQNVVSPNIKTVPAGIERVLATFETREQDITTNNANFYVTRCPVEHNHRNGDSRPSLHFKEIISQDDSEDRTVYFNCLSGGCTLTDILQALGLTPDDIYSKDNASSKRNSLRRYFESDSAKKALTVQEFSMSKRLPTEFLMLNMLISDDVFTFHKDAIPYKKKGVHFPYLLPDGTPHERAKLRTAMAKVKKSDNIYYFKEGDDTPILFGLQALHEAKKLGYVVFVEGESDTCTLLYHGIPALGVSGAGNAEKYTTSTLALIPDLLEGINTVYVSQEKTDQAGINFPYSVKLALKKVGYTGEILRIPLRNLTGAKDPSELHVSLYEQAEKPVSEQALHTTYRAKFQDCLNQAKTMDGDTSTGLPEIIISGRQYREIGEQALQAMAQGEKTSRTVFVKAGALVRVARDEKGNPMVQNIGTSEIRNMLTQTANYYRLKKSPKPEEDPLTPASPPKELAEYILAMSPSEWPFPPLAGVVEMPIMRPDGSILDTPGYDENTHLYYVASNAMAQCKVPLIPTKEQRMQAVELINTCIGEFFYESPADYANMFALLITLVTRYMYDGDVMTALINATKPGTGKSLLAQFGCIIATGRPSAMTNFPAKEEETKKVIDAKVLAGVHTIVFDNIKRKFQSASLDMLSTCRGYYSVRPLGQSKDITVYTQATVIATGNNIEIDTDQARRCFQIRLISPISNPDERTDVTIKDLPNYAIDHRPELVSALLTIVRSWHVDGKPHVKNRLEVSSFGAWAGIVGDVLAHAGIHGFQDNRDALKSEANSDEQQITNFLQTWHNTYKDKYMPAMAILDHILLDVDIENKVITGKASQFLATLPDDLRGKLFDRERKKQSMIQILAKWLSERVKTPYGRENYRIEYTQDTVKCQKIWRVGTGGTGGTGGDNGLKAPDFKNDKSENSDKNNKNAGTQQPLSPPVPPVPPVEEMDSKPTEQDENGHLEQQITKTLASLQKLRGRVVQTRNDGWCTVDDIGLGRVTLSRYGKQFDYRGLRILEIETGSNS